MEIKVRTLTTAYGHIEGMVDRALPQFGIRQNLEKEPDRRQRQMELNENENPKLKHDKEQSTNVGRPCVTSV